MAVFYEKRDYFYVAYYLDVYFLVKKMLFRHLRNIFSHKYYSSE